MNKNVDIECPYCGNLLSVKLEQIRFEEMYYQYHFHPQCKKEFLLAVSWHPYADVYVTANSSKAINSHNDDCGDSPDAFGFTRYTKRSDDWVLARCWERHEDWQCRNTKWLPLLNGNRLERWYCHQHAEKHKDEKYLHENLLIEAQKIELEEKADG